MDLLALADFTLVARYGGFGRASRAAHRPKATLSRRVAGLEASLNLRLFERGTRDLKLTEEGRALYERAGQLLTELEETAAAIASGGTQVRGRMRISVPLLFSQIAMGRLAAEFARRHPDVRLEVTTEDRAVDMIEEEFDLAIRVNPDPNETLVGRPFLRDRLVVVASPDLPCVDGAPVPAVVRHVAKDERWSVTDVRGEASMDIAPVLCLSSMIMIRDAVRAGAGAAQLPISLVAQDIAQGRLAHWADVPRSDIVLWALYPTRRLLSARVSAFRDFLKDIFPTGSPDELGAFLGA